MSADLASLRIAEERIEWGAEETGESAYLRWYRCTSREDAERCVARWKHEFPTKAFRVVSRRVIVTQWADADE